MSRNVKTGATIEARMRSSRLPGKVLAEIVPGWTLLDVIVGRAVRAQSLDEIVVATTTNHADDDIADHCAAKGYACFRGDEDDVLARVLKVVRGRNFERWVRLTGDNPLIDGRVIDAIVARLRDGAFDYVATTMMGHSETWREERSFPRGVSMEVTHGAVLEMVASCARLPIERESPTFYIYDHPDEYRLNAFQAEGAFASWRQPDLRLTVDTPEDLELVRRVFGRIGYDDPASFGTDAAIALVAGDPELQSINRQVPHKIASEIRRSQERLATRQ